MPDLDTWPCAVCGGEVGVLGVLGNLVHTRCRACGAQFSSELDDSEKPEAVKLEATE